MTRYFGKYRTLMTDRCGMTFEVHPKAGTFVNREPHVFARLILWLYCFFWIIVFVITTCSGRQKNAALHFGTPSFEQRTRYISTKNSAGSRGRSTRPEVKSASVGQPPTIPSSKSNLPSVPSNSVAKPVVVKGEYV